MKWQSCAKSELPQNCVGDFLFSQKFKLFSRKLKYADDLAKNLANW
jgi:hypothetical protein